MRYSLEKLDPWTARKKKRRENKSSVEFEISFLRVSRVITYGSSRSPAKSSTLRSAAGSSPPRDARSWSRTTTTRSVTQSASLTYFRLKSFIRNLFPTINSSSLVGRSTRSEKLGPKFRTKIRTSFFFFFFTRGMSELFSSRESLPC